MATTKIWPVRVNLDSVVDYAKSPNKTENPNYLEDDLQGLYDVMNYATKSSKTEKKYYVSGINCSPDMARQKMIMTKKRYGKEGGIVAFHAYQSFKPGEITPDQAHQLGMQLSHVLWGNRFEVIPCRKSREANPIQFYEMGYRRSNQAVHHTKAFF